MGEGWDVIGETARGAKFILDHGCLATGGRRVRRVPLSHVKFTEGIKVKNEKDELWLIHMQGRGEDWSNEAYKKSSSEGAKRKSTCPGCFGWGFCAIRFKYFTARGLAPSTCQRCGGADSFDHLLRCAGVELPSPSEDPAPTIAFLVQLAWGEHLIHSGAPVPRWPTSVGEISLAMDSNLESAQEESAPEDVSMEEIEFPDGMGRIGMNREGGRNFSGFWGRSREAVGAKSDRRSYGCRLCSGDPLLAPCRLGRCLQGCTSLGLPGWRRAASDGGYAREHYVLRCVI